MQLRVKFYLGDVLTKGIKEMLDYLSRCAHCGYEPFLNQIFWYFLTYRSKKHIDTVYI